MKNKNLYKDADLTIIKALTEETTAALEVTFAAWNNNSTPHFIRSNDIDLIEFLGKCEFTTDGQWRWCGTKLPGGYGIFRKQYAHRWIFEKWFSVRLPNELRVCHLFNQPSDVSPFNLFAAPQKVNLLHASQQGRLSAPRPRLTLEDKQNIFTRFSGGEACWAIAASTGKSHTTVFRLKKLYNELTALSKQLEPLTKKDDQEVV